MSSDFWDNLRKATLARDNYMCFICERKVKLDVHKLVYPKNLYDIKMYSCISLCPGCHKKIHKKLERLKDDR